MSASRFLLAVLAVLLLIPADAVQAQADGAVLVFSRTAGFRHASIPDGIAAVQALGTTHGFSVTATEDAAAFTEAGLAGYDAVVFLNTTGDVLNPAQQTAMEGYMRMGGGFVGIHAAADTEYDWAWYGGLVGAYFASHPDGTPAATVQVVDRVHPATADLPAEWARVDEWYNYRQNPRGDVHVLATLDERTYAGGTMRGDHPIAWCQPYEGGRAFYTGGGHTPESFSNTAFRGHLWGGLAWAAGWAEGNCTATVETSWEKTILDADVIDPMELAVAEDGRVFFVERPGRVKVWSPEDARTILAATLPGHHELRGRPARHHARPRLHHQRLGVPLLLARRLGPHPAPLALHGHQHVSRPRLRGRPARSPDRPRPGRPLGRLARLRPRRAALHRHRRRRRPVRLRRLRAHRRARRAGLVGRAAHLRQPVRFARQDPAPPPAGRRHGRNPRRQPLPSRRLRGPPRSLRDGRPQPVPPQRGPGERLALLGRRGAGRERQQSQPRPARLRRGQPGPRGRLLRLALLHRRQQALPRLRLRHRPVRPVVYLRRRPQQFAERGPGPRRAAAGPERVGVVSVRLVARVSRPARRRRADGDGRPRGARRGRRRRRTAGLLRRLGVRLRMVAQLDRGDAPGRRRAAARLPALSPEPRPEPAHRPRTRRRRRALPGRVGLGLRRRQPRRRAEPHRLRQRHARPRRRAPGVRDQRTRPARRHLLQRRHLPPGRPRAGLRLGPRRRRRHRRHRPRRRLDLLRRRHLRRPPHGDRFQRARRHLHRHHRRRQLAAHRHRGAARRRRLFRLGRLHPLRRGRLRPRGRQHGRRQHQLRGPRGAARRGARRPQPPARRIPRLREHLPRARRPRRRCGQRVRRRRGALHRRRRRRRGRAHGPTPGGAPAQPAGGRALHGAVGRAGGSHGRPQRPGKRRLHRRWGLADGTSRSTSSASTS